MNTRSQTYLAITGMAFLIGTAYGVLWHNCVADTTMFTPAATTAELARVRAQQTEQTQSVPRTDQTPTNQTNRE